jgi:hypothetical protein
MTSAQINLLFIGLIVIAAALIVYAVLKYTRRWWFWFVPVFTFLLFGFVYSAVYLVNVADGSLSDPLLFNLYNQLMRGSIYVIIIAYAVVFIAVQRKVTGGKDG